MAIITVSALSEAAKTYQKDLRYLPYGMLVPELDRLGIGMLQVANIDVKMGFERLGGGLRPYAIAQANPDYSDLGKFTERELKVETAYAAMKDHILNYQDKKYVNPVAGTAINQTKKHPLEALIIGEKVKTYAEDVLDALYHGKRDTADLSPIGAFTGFETIIKAEIVATTVAAGKGNLKTTGIFAAPVDENDVAAIGKLVTFVRSGHPMMRRYPTILQMSEQVAFWALDALQNKKKYRADVTLDMLSAYINEQCGSKVTCVISQHMGTGGRLVWTVPGNLDFGMNTFGDHEFVQVRAPFEDPNIMQYWIQSAFGCRITNLHQKVFCTNEQVLTSVRLSGDYV